MAVILQAAPKRKRAAPAAKKRGAVQYADDSEEEEEAHAQVKKPAPARRLPGSISQMTAAPPSQQPAAKGWGSFK